MRLFYMEYYNFSLCFPSCPGTAFLCSVLVAPVKTESGSVVMYIVNHEDVTWSPNRDEVLPKRKCKHF